MWRKDTCYKLGLRIKTPEYHQRSNIHILEVVEQKPQRGTGPRTEPWGTLDGGAAEEVLGTLTKLRSGLRSSNV